MRKVLVTGAVLIVLPFLLIPAFPKDINAGNWPILLAAGIGLAVFALSFGWIASREGVQRSDSRVARTLRRLTSDDDE